MAALDLSTLLTAVDFSSTTVAIIGLAAAFIVVVVAWFASQMVLAALKGEVFYNGKRYKREVWETALGTVKKQMRGGGLVDKASRDAVLRYEGVGKSRSRSSRSRI